jgi:hypothetical protein
LRASCGRITELLEGAVAARAVQVYVQLYVAFGAVCRSRTIIRLRSLAPSDLACGSGRPRRGAHRPNRPHVTRNDQWLTESHIHPAVGSLPTRQAAAVVHYAQAGAVGDCASRNNGVSAGIEASGAARSATYQLRRRLERAVR